MQPQQNNNRKFNRDERPQSEFTDKVVQIKRVSKKTKGGNQIHFTALVVSGDKKTRVGVGLGKAKSVAEAIQKGASRAHKSMVTVPIVNAFGTIPYFLAKFTKLIHCPPSPTGEFRYHFTF